MPSPIIHLSVGAFTHGALKRRWRDATPLRRTAYVLAFLFFAMMPDLDSVIGIALNDLGRFHNNIAHSFGFALIAGCAAWLLAPLFGERKRRFWAAVVFGSYAGHILLDAITRGRGVMLFWPITDLRIQPPFQIFYGLQWSHGLVSIEHFVTAGTEGLVVLLVAWLVLRLRRKGISKTDHGITNTD